MKEVALLTHKKDLVNSWEKEGERIDTSLLLRFQVEFVGEGLFHAQKKSVPTPSAALPCCRSFVFVTPPAAP